MKFTNTSTNTHMTRVYRNRDKLLTCALCVLLALPGLAAAKKPANEGCAVLLPAYIETGTSFSVKVVRVPSYPGSWTHPTIYTDVVYPMPPGESSTDSKEQTIKFSVTYALASFMVPPMNTGILNSPTTTDATASVTVTVSEPLRNNKVKLTTCSSTTPVMKGL